MSPCNNEDVERFLAVVSLTTTMEKHGRSHAKNRQPRSHSATMKGISIQNSPETKALRQ